MARRGRSLRRRYGRARGYRIGAGGLEKTASIALVPGRRYSMGASSSPEVIVVDQVLDDRIKYHSASQYRDQAPRTIERWIGEDLISQGERTFKGQYGVSTDAWYNMSEDERGERIRRHLRGG